MKTLEDIVLNDFKWAEEDLALVRELLEINENKIKNSILRWYLPYGYGMCARFANELVENRLATFAEPDDILKRPNTNPRGFGLGSIDV